VFWGIYYIYILYIYMGMNPLPSLSCVPAGTMFPGVNQQEEGGNIASQGSALEP
jgi:hypothetical protein